MRETFRRSTQWEGADLQCHQNSFSNLIITAPKTHPGEILQVRLKQAKKIMDLIYKPRKILFQRKFTKSLAAWMEQPGQVSVPGPQEQAEKPRNPLENPPELPRAILSPRHVLRAAIMFLSVIEE